MLPEIRGPNISGNALSTYANVMHLRNALAGGNQTTQSTGQTAPQGDNAILGLIRDFEGYRESPYWDVNAYRAGYGSDTVTLEDGTVIPVRQGMSVDREAAERDLMRRVNTEFMPSAVNAIGQDQFNALHPQQQAALVSLAYNYGAGAWDDDLSGVTNALRTGGDARGAIMALGSHNDGINRSRRAREASYF
ncbi:hypothetical protein Q5Y75_05640 [Ruegeria sp. 2205SS24-7]|uniref:lysozyme n=1 Tax=Ruegeria discodermiae TaxID=3064389 RepID=UPI002741E7C8|nr:hypothetical protein [Ruegeria sp. 2205SS24-7]MDP5216693.1 hypothetical protein [Ruegeria sp. 2205SS24-7]